MKINSLAILFLIAILLPANIVPAFSQTSSNNLENFLVGLSLSPSHVDEHNSAHSVGYVNLVNKNGLAIKAPQDFAIGLESDDPSIVSVPTSVTIPKGHNFVIFDIQTGDKNGETTISTLFNDQIDFKNFKVGGADDSMPDGISIKINFPTNNMHVNSEMPFSVYLQTSDGDIIRNIDVFVSLVDSDGLPAVTPVDVTLELFSDEDVVGRKLDDRMKDTD